MNVRIVGKEFSGIMSYEEAKTIAEEKGLTLKELIQKKQDQKIYVAVNEEKENFEHDKKLKKLQLQQKRNNEIKEISFRQNISTNDLNTKINQCIKFGEKRIRVKLMLEIKGRQMSRHEDYKHLIETFIENVSHLYKKESEIKFDKNKYTILLIPK